MKEMNGRAFEVEAGSVADLALVFVNTYPQCVLPPTTGQQ